MSIAWVFPGQGSQFVGMARDLYERSPAARAVLDAADAALGFPLTRLMFEGPEAELTETINAQPAILAHSVAALAAWQESAGESFVLPALCAGHSLGEYSALVAAGALDLSDAIKLVRARGLAMQRASRARPGAMAAILGLDDARLLEICAAAGAVQIANLNAPGQIVLSGEQQALARAVEAAKKSGAKRAVMLAVSIAAHSELMRPAVDEFRTAVMTTPLRQPRVPVISNVTAQPLTDTQAIREEMLAQLTAPVQWVKSVEWMEAQGVNEFIEIGPKDVLCGLIKRIAKEARTHALGTLEQIENLQGVIA